MLSTLFSQVPAYFSAETLTTFAMIAIGIGAALIFFILLYPFIRPRKEETLELEQEHDKGIFGFMTPALAAVIPESEKETNDFNLLLRQAGIYQASARNSIYAMRLLLLLLPIFLAMYLGVLVPEKMTTYLMIGLFTGATLTIIPRLYVFFVRRHRLEEIRRGMADTIDMFGMCASGGMTTSESLEHVSEQLNEYPELARELRILRRQAEVGGLESAAADLVQRVNLREMRLFANLLLRGSKLGHQMAGTLNEQADHIRVTRRHMAMAQANKTPSKLVFPLMFCFAPAALILMLSPCLMDVADFMGSKNDLAPSSITNAMNSSTELNVGMTGQAQK